MPAALGAVVGDRPVALGDQVAVEEQQDAGTQAVGRAVVPARDPPHPERLVVEAQHLVARRVRVVERGLEDAGDAVHQGPSRSIAQPSPSRV